MCPRKETDQYMSPRTETDTHGDRHVHVPPERRQTSTCAISNLQRMNSNKRCIYFVSESHKPKPYPNP